MLNHMLFQIASRYPDKEALLCNERTILYSQLYEQVVGFSIGLSRLGIQVSDTIILSIPNGIEFIVSFFAIARLHAIVLPLNPLFTDAEIQKFFEEAEIKALITDQQHVSRYQAIAQRLGKTITFITIDAPASAATTLFPTYTLSDLSAVTADTCTPDVYEGNLLYHYSSGSTGRSKKLYRTQKHLFWEALDFTQTASITATDRIFCAVPLYHAHGLGNCMLAALYSGATLVILEQARHEGRAVEMPLAARSGRIFELLKNAKITVFPGVAHIFDALATTAPDATQHDLSTLRLCFTAGNTLPQEVFERFQQRFGITIRQLYGCTEAGSVSINMEEGSTFLWNSVGKPMVNVEVKIVDDAGQTLPAEVCGEIAFKSPSLTNGYHHLPALNEQVFKDGYFFSGDLGKLDVRGLITIMGRKRIFIDTGGYKVDPLEVVEVIKTYPGVNEVVVIGVPVPSGGELVKAVVIPGAGFQKLGLLTWCRERLSQFKVPKVVEIRSELPRNGLGKILYKDLIEEVAYEQRVQDGSLGEQLRTLGSARQRKTLMETYLKDMCAEVFAIEDTATIEVDKPLGEFGLDSISALEIRDRLDCDLGMQLSATLLWSYPTIGTLASYFSTLQTPSAHVFAQSHDMQTGTESHLLPDSSQAIEGLTDEEASQLLATILEEITPHE